MLPNFRFHHLGIAVFDIDITAAYYIESGYRKSETILDPIQNVYICFLNKKDMPQIELLAPVDDSSPVFKTLQKNGVSPYHCCYEVDDINLAITDLKKKKFIVLIKPVEAVAIDNRNVCFLFNKNVGLIELVEI